MPTDSDKPNPTAESSHEDPTSAPLSSSESPIAEMDATFSSPHPDGDFHTTGRSGGKQAKTSVNKRTSPQILGDFELQHEIGRGGMGVVYEARQRSLDKRVAVKVLPFSAVLDQRAVKRFQNEAWAAAQLQHRNIIPVYQVGSERGVHFYAMQYVEGGDLGDLFTALRGALLNGLSDTVVQADSPILDETEDAPRIDSSVPSASATTAKGDRSASAARGDSTHKSGWSKGDTLASRQLLELIAKNRTTSVPQFIKAFVSMGIQVADALHYAHEMGIVHRDIKPSNLLLDVEGEVWVADFGLAQIQSDPGMTATGAMVGTLRYMSPEQAIGKRVGVDHRTDIYSLGVTLYELLTLRPAFAGDSRENILRKIAFDDPPRPRKIDRRIPIELETIVMKAISKNPADRYQTSAELAEDFRRFRDDQPIMGRKPTAQQQILRWARRNRPLVASIGALSAITFIAAILIALVSWNYYIATLAALQSEQDQRAKIEQLLQRSEGLRLAANSSLQLDENPARALLLAVEAAKHYPGIEANDAIMQALDASYEFQTLSGHVGPVGHLAFRPDGKAMITTSERSRFDVAADPAHIWNTETGDLIGKLQPDNRAITSAVYCPDKIRVLTTSSPPEDLATDDSAGKLVGESPSVWDSVALEKLFHFPEAFLFETHDALFDATNRRVVLPTLGHRATIYDYTTGDPIIPLIGHDKRVIFAAYSPLGDHVVTASDDNTVRIWNAKTGDQVYEFDLWKRRAPRAEECLIDSLAFRPDGRQLVTGSKQFGTHIWDLTSGDRVEHEHLVGSDVKYWPDGMQLLSFRQSDRAATSHRVSDGKTLDVFKHRDIHLRLAVISPDGRWVATNGHSNSKTVFIWNVATGQIAAELKGHEASINAIAFHPDSMTVATASEDKTVKHWHIQGGRQRSLYATRCWPTNPIATASPDGKFFAIVDQASATAARITRFAQPEEAIEISGRIWMPDPSSNRFVVTDGDRLSLHSVSDGSEIKAIINPRGPASQAAINHTGDRAAVFGGGESITLWIPDEDRQLPLSIGPTKVHDLEFSPGGRVLAAATADGFVRVWDVDTAALLASLANDAKVLDVEFDSDGSRFVAVTDQNRAHVWDWKNQQITATLQSIDASFTSANFTFDDAHLISYRSVDAEAVFLWASETGELQSRFATEGEIQVATNPVAAEVLITSSTKGATIWQYDQNAPIPVTETPMISGDYSPDGSQLIIASSVPVTSNPWQPSASRGTVSRSVLERWDRQGLERQESIPLNSASIFECFFHGDAMALINVHHRFGIVNYGIDSHRAVNRVAGHIAPISAALFRSDSKQLITTSWDQRVAIWDATDGRPIRSLAEHEAAIYCAAIAKNDKLLATGDADGQCIVWNLESGEVQQRFRPSQSPLEQVSFSPAGDRVMMITADGALQLHDLQSNRPIDIDIGESVVDWAEFSPDGGTLLVIPRLDPKPQADVAAAVDYKVLIVPLRGDSITSIAHRGPIVTAHFHPDGTRIITATSNGAVTLRDAKSGVVEYSFANSGRIRAAVLDDAGEYLAIALRDGTDLWSVDPPRRWLSLPAKSMVTRRMHRFDPFVPNSARLITQHFDTMDFRDWPIMPAEFARTQSSRTLSAEERARFFIDDQARNDPRSDQR